MWTLARHVFGFLGRGGSCGGADVYVHCGRIWPDLLRLNGSWGSQVTEKSGRNCSWFTQSRVWAWIHWFWNNYVANSGSLEYAVFGGAVYVSRQFCGSDNLQLERCMMSLVGLHRPDICLHSKFLWPRIQWIPSKVIRNYALICSHQSFALQLRPDLPRSTKPANLSLSKSCSSTCKQYVGSTTSVICYATSFSSNFVTTFTENYC